MKIFLDNIIFSLQTMGGISIYWYELIKRFNAKNLDITFINQEGHKKSFFFNKLTFIKSKYLNEIPFPLVFLRFLPIMSRLQNGAIFHSSYQRVSFQKDIINIITIHDLGYELNIMQTGFKRKLHLYFKGKAINRSQGIICVSHSTKEDLLKFYPNLDPKRVCVIYNGISSEYNYNNEAYSTEVRNLNYIVFVGARHEYKNFKLTIDTVSKSDLELLIVGGSSLSKSELEYLNKNLNGRFKYLGKISNEELADIYRQAFCLLYPSLYEGFGIPLIEAMACGCPVIGINISSIPEIVDNAGILINSPNINDLIHAMDSLKDKEYRAELIRRGFVVSNKFSWDKCCEETISFYHYISQIKN